MVAAYQNDSIPSIGFNRVAQVKRLADRVRHYFDQHPELDHDIFFLDAVRKEIDFREQWETENVTGPAYREGETTNKSFAVRPRLSAEDIRLHAWLNERLAVLHYERYGLWPRLRRLLFGNRLTQLLGLPGRGVPTRKE